MSHQDPIADMLTRIRNAALASKAEVKMPLSKIKAAIAAVLVKEGYIKDFSIEDEKPKQTLKLVLKYTKGNRAVIDCIQRVSKPGVRRYAAVDELPRVLGGLGVAIISTSKGVMTDREARKNNLGGEVLCILY